MIGTRDTVQEYLATSFADTEAKNHLIAKYPKQYKDHIKNNSWNDLCNNAVPDILVNKTVLKHREEMYKMMFDFLTEALPPLFEEKYTKENLTQEEIDLFKTIPMYSTTKENQEKLLTELNFLLKCYLMAKNNQDILGMSTLKSSAENLRERNYGLLSNRQ